VLLCDVVDVAHCVRAARCDAFLATIGADLASAMSPRQRATLLEQLQSLSREPALAGPSCPAASEGDGMVFAGLGGMLRTAQLEHPRYRGQVVAVEPGQDIAAALRDNATTAPITCVTSQGERQVAGWQEFTAAICRGPLPWKDQGVYLITGGAGGLGLIFAREIAMQVRNPVLVLTGRTPLNEGIQARIRELEALGAVVRYHAVDVSRSRSPGQLVQSIPEEFESLDGIIHSAGVVRDSFIAKEDASEQLREVLSAKVAGTFAPRRSQPRHGARLLHRVLVDCRCDRQCGAGGLRGGNAFMDAFAHHRNAQVAAGLRRGRTLSVNWPLWDEGGMQVDEATRAMLARQWGMHPLGSVDGVNALRQVWASGEGQAGDRRRRGAYPRVVLSASFIGHRSRRLVTATGKNVAAPGKAPAWRNR
jgi:hypothetical protein